MELSAICLGLDGIKEDYQLTELAIVTKLLRVPQLLHEVGSCNPFTLLSLLSGFLHVLLQMHLHVGEAAVRLQELPQFVS